METPNLYLVDEHGEQLADHVIEAANHIANSIFHRYRSIDPAEIANAIEQSARMTARQLRKGRSLKLRAFLWTITTNAIRARLELRSRERSVSADLLEDLAGSHGTAHQFEMQVAVREAMEHLPERERSILAMKSQGLSSKEIARHMGMSAINVDTIACRAREKVCDTLGRHLRG
jgi:RNA polymerase sigma factor (sigma-70 family)